jgi:hypothetical protein
MAFEGFSGDSTDETLVEDAKEKAVSSRKGLLVKGLVHYRGAEPVPWTRNFIRTSPRRTDYVP